MIVNLKVNLSTCGSLASTVSDSEDDDDAFVGPIASWFFFFFFLLLLLCRAAFDATLSHTGGQARKNN